MEAVLAGAGAPGGLDAACLGEPVPVVPAGDPARFPLVFPPYVALHQMPGGPEFGHLRELGEPLTGARWGSPLEINPRTAEAAGICDGELVAIESPAGSIKVRVSYFEGVPPDAVRMAVGGGRPWDLGRPTDGGDAGGSWRRAARTRWAGRRWQACACD